MNLELDGDLATIDGSHDGVRTRASPKLIIAPKSAELALRLASPNPKLAPSPRCVFPDVAYSTIRRANL